MDALCSAIEFTSPNYMDVICPTPQAEQDVEGSASIDEEPMRVSVSHPSPSVSDATQIYRCHLCDRVYERADHLNRHLKSHENARAHKCTQCTKSFNRADLLSRHQASHERYANGAKTPRRWRCDRVGTACNACVASKSKCQDQKPCIRCQNRGIPCEIGTQSMSSRNPSVETSQVKFLLDEDSISGSERQQSSKNEPSPYAKRNPRNTQQRRPLLQTDTGIDRHSIIGNYAPIVPGHVISNDNEVTNPNLGYSEHQVDLNTNLGHSFHYDNIYNDEFSFLDQDKNFDQNLGSIPWNTYFGQDIDFGIGDIDIESVELIYTNLDTVQNRDVESGQTDQLSTWRGNSRRFAAFERSPWLWTPTNKDKALNDQEDISLDEDNIPDVLTPASPESTISEFISCTIDSRMRDRMLSVLFSLPNVDARNHSSFPSLSLLNTIIQVYFAQESYKVDQFIHSATLAPAKSLPHLILAIVAGGSTYISNPAIWKMGLALQEVVRHAIADLWEHNNSQTRNLQALQAFVLGLDIGLWSGFKRKMEIAESFAQPVIIMLRRAGAFDVQRTSPAPAPSQDDTDATLESKWRKWVEQESFKRLVLHLFFHDVHASAGLQKPPLISLAELRFDLPASRELWMAKSAAVWKELYLAKVPSIRKKFTFMNALEDPESLQSMADYIDIHLCSMTLLHGYWSQIWALGESKKFYPASRTTHHLSLITSHRELYRDLTDLSERMPSLTRNSAVAALLSEFFMMILHVSPEDLQRFAGKSGEDEARDAYTLFKTWTQTSESRAAIWHAGQVLRAARRMMPTQLRGFNAIALYFASLTLWVYGLATSTDLASLSGVPDRTILGFSSPSTKRHVEIILNEVETSQLSGYKSSGKGIPGIMGLDLDRMTLFAPLTDTDKILGIVRDVYRSNFPIAEGALPPLVANLVKLLKELSGLPSSKISRAPSPRLEPQ